MTRARLLLACAAVMVAAPLRAGQRYDDHVRMYPEASHPSAHGSLGSARRTFDRVADIGCTFTVGGLVDYTELQPRAFCSANQPIRLTIGTPSLCHFHKSDSPEMWRALLTINQQSYVRFFWRWSNTYAQMLCDNLEVINSSGNETVAP